MVLLGTPLALEVLEIDAEVVLGMQLVSARGVPQHPLKHVNDLHHRCHPTIGAAHRAHIRDALVAGLAQTAVLTVELPAGLYITYCNGCPRSSS